MTPGTHIEARLLGVFSLHVVAIGVDFLSSEFVSILDENICSLVSMEMQ